MSSKSNSKIKTKSDQAAPQGYKYCAWCSEIKEEHLFQTICVNIRDSSRKLSLDNANCNECRYTKKMKSYSRDYFKKYRLKVAPEKLRVWNLYKESNPGCKGCGAECPCDFEALEKTLCKVLHDKLLGDEEEQVDERLDIVMASILEWDHDIPLGKVKQVSRILGDKERWEEMEKCTLRCVICHRLKTWKYGDSTYNKKDSGSVTRARLKAYLELKKDSLDSYAYYYEDTTQTKFAKFPSHKEFLRRLLIMVCATSMIPKLQSPSDT